jgi:aminoglycoside 3-N-acetyltransferase I
MNVLTAQQIKEIADRLDFHERCFVDPTSGEVEFGLNFESGDFDEKEFFSGIGGEEGKAAKARYKKVLKSWKEIEPMESREVFEMMEAFVAIVPEMAVKDRLFKALRGPKPFAKFRWEMDNAGKYRQQWFDFKLSQTILFIEKQLQLHKITFEAVAPSAPAQDNTLATEQPWNDNLIQVQRLGRNHEEALRELTLLFQEVFESDTAPTASLSYLSQLLRSELLVVYNVYYDHQLVGGLTAYVLHHYRDEALELFIYDLAVRPEFQRRGLGKRLMRALQSYAKKNGFQEIFVAADVEDQHALDFYRAAGGRESDVKHFTFGVRN